MNSGSLTTNQPPMLLGDEVNSALLQPETELSMWWQTAIVKSPDLATTVRKDTSTGDKDQSN